MTERRRITSEDKKRERKSKKSAASPIKKWFKRIVLTIVLIGVIGLISGIGVFAYYASTAPELDEELLKYPISSEFYDVNGDLFAKLGAENRTYVAYEDIPDEMVNAIIATEDSRFFDHFGIDVWRLGSAVVANFRDGFGAQGASTITQQVVKNSFLKNEKKLKRKAQEAWLAVQLERKYSKEEIFEMYFNRVLMSGTVYGFGTAAEYFYGKELNELSLGEMAQLAGMPQSPNNYNPFTNPEAAQKRRDIVLSLMVQHKKVTQAQATEAKATTVSDTLLAEDERKSNSEIKYPAYLSAVINELRENGDYELLSEGIKVYTNLDPSAQESVESTMNNDANFPTEDIQAGVAVVDTATGAVRAIGGGRNYGSDLLFNRATDVDPRSPGSAAKPLISYGPAIENLKWSTGQTTVDEKTTYPNSSQVITNWDGKYNGKMTIRQALYTSRNVPAVNTLLEVGTDESKKFINNLGIKMDNVYPSSALGGNVHADPVQLASAYAAFGNNGVFNEGHTITKIIYRDGKTSKNYKPESKLAMSDYTAYMITDMLRDTVSTLPGASAPNAIVSGVDIAGKTGTSNYSSDDFKKWKLPSSAVPDAWFIGYTTDYSVAIWSGYDDYSDPITTWPERRLSQTLFKSIMTKLVNDKKPSTFKKPSSVVEATIEVGTSPLKLASEYTPSDKRRTELFVKGTAPSTVSDKYQAPEVGGITNLAAVYDKTSNTINLAWDYSSDAEDTSDVTYEITMKTDNGKSSVIGTSSSPNYQVSSIEPGKTYTFTVTPIIDGNAGKSASTKVLVAAQDKPNEDDDEDDSNTTDPNNPGVIPPTEPSNPSNGNNGGTNGNKDEDDDDVTPPNGKPDGSTSDSQDSNNSTANGPNSIIDEPKVN